MKPFLALLGAVLLASQCALAQPTIEQKPVQFRKGESGATLKGTLRGAQTVDYTVHAGAGQVMRVVFKPGNPSAYFNVLPPGSEQAIFIGSSSGNEFSAQLKGTGTYTIRVYLMRNAARRNESASYTLDVGVAGAVKTSGPVAGATVAGHALPAKWDASGEVKCSVGADRFDRACGFRVVRDLQNRAADIWVTSIASGEAGFRVLRYADKVFTTDDRAARLAWQRRDDNWWVSVDGKEFYLLPDALIHGG